MVLSGVYKTQLYRWSLYRTDSEVYCCRRYCCCCCSYSSPVSMTKTHGHDLTSSEGAHYPVGSSVSPAFQLEAAAVDRARPRSRPPPAIPPHENDTQLPLSDIGHRDTNAAVTEASQARVEVVRFLPRPPVSSPLAAARRFHSQP